MDFKTASGQCHMRSAIFRTSMPTKIFTVDDLEQIHPAIRHLHIEVVGTEVPNLYWKNHQESLDERVPVNEQVSLDWEEYDPREDNWASLFTFND